jgi:hypothetical protein
MRLCDVSHLLFAVYTPIHADFRAKVTGRPAKIRVVDREQA